MDPLWDQAFRSDPGACLIHHLRRSAGIGTPAVAATSGYRGRSRQQLAMVRARAISSSHPVHQRVCLVYSRGANLT